MAYSPKAEPSMPEPVMPEPPMSGIMATFVGGVGGYATLTMNVGSMLVHGTNYAYGYVTSSYGSLAPTTFPPVPSNSIQTLNFNSANNLYTLSLSSPAVNSGWISVTINGLTLARSSGSFSTYGWTWNASDNGAALVNAYGTNVKISFA